MSVVNIDDVSCKYRDTLQEKQLNKIVKALWISELSMGRGLNQKTSLQWACDTR